MLLATYIPALEEEVSLVEGGLVTLFYVQHVYGLVENQQMAGSE